jgi:hypothetical protein
MCKIIIFLCIPQWCNQILGGLNTTPVFPIGRATDQSGLAYQPKGDLFPAFFGASLEQPKNDFKPISATEAMT